MFVTFNNILSANNIKQQKKYNHTEAKASSIKTNDNVNNTQASDIIANQNIALLNLSFKGESDKVQKEKRLIPTIPRECNGNSFI